jgi:hypothetical protein
VRFFGEQTLKLDADRIERFRQGSTIRRFTIRRSDVRRASSINTGNVEAQRKRSRPYLYVTMGASCRRCRCNGLRSSSVLLVVDQHRANLVASTPSTLWFDEPTIIPRASVTGRKAWRAPASQIIDPDVLCRGSGVPLDM